jgi:hypothetical protein
LAKAESTQGFSGYVAAQGHEEGESIDPSDISDLDEGKVAVLRVAEELPRKPREQRGASKLAAHP